MHSGDGIFSLMATERQYSKGTGSGRRSHWSPEQRSVMAVTETKLVGSPRLSALRGGICHPCLATQKLSVIQLK